MPNPTGILSKIPSCSPYTAGSPLQTCLCTLLTSQALHNCASQNVLWYSPYPHHTVASIKWPMSLSRLQYPHTLTAVHLWAAIAMWGLCQSTEKGFLPNFWLFLGPKQKVLHENSPFSFHLLSSSSTQISQCIVVRDRCHSFPQWSCVQITQLQNSFLLPPSPTKCHFID